VDSIALATVDRPVMTMIAVSPPASLLRSSKSKPLMPGRLMSTKATSKPPLSRCGKASSAVAAVCTS
jgi:hypothetical protein